VLKQDELRREIFPIRAIPYLPKKLSLKIRGRDSVSNGLVNNEGRNSNANGNLLRFSITENSKIDED